MIMAAASTSGQDALPLGKYLASTDKKTRDKAIKNLSIFLSDPTRDGLPKAEMAKLWKGIFYCFWMSDKPLVQQALATEIADILLTIPNTSSSLGFLQGFWEATVREWPGIDRLRIDKYYMLIRRFVNASFRLLVREDWDTTHVTEYNAILTSQGGPLCPEDTRVLPSLQYHLADIYLEELEKALSRSESDTPPPAPLQTLLDPFLALAARSPTKTTIQRIQASLLDPLFDSLAPEDQEVEEVEEKKDGRSRKRQRLSEPEFQHVLKGSCTVDSKKEGTLSIPALKKALLKRVFDVASNEKTRDANRRKLYAFWKSYTDEDSDDSD